MKYVIRYDHRSSESAPSLRAALRLVRWEIGTRRLALANCADGIYCWRSRAEMLRDTSGGAAADAVICLSSATE